MHPLILRIANKVRNLCGKTYQATATPEAEVERDAEAAATPPTVLASLAMLPIWRIIAFVLVIVSGVLVQRHYRAKPAGQDVAKNTNGVTPTKKATRKDIPEAAQNNEIGANLGKLLAAAQAYRRLNPGATPAFDALVGPNKAIPVLESVVGEVYPNELPPGPISATRPDGVIFTFDELWHLTRSDAPVLPVPQLAPPDPNEPQGKFASIQDYKLREWMLARYKKLDASGLFQSMLDAGRIEQDVIKQQALQNLLLIEFNSRTPSAEFQSRMTDFLGNPSTPKEERELLLSAISHSHNPAMVRYLCWVATDAKSPFAHQPARNALEQLGAFQLEQVWCEYNDEMLLKYVARPMAEHGTATGADLLIRAITSSEPRWAVRKNAALTGAGLLQSPQTLPAFLAHLKDQPLTSWNTQWLAIKIIEFGAEEEGKLVLRCITNTETDLTNFLRTLGELSTNKPEIKAVWASALKSSVTFRNEKNREAIRDHLAPPSMQYSLKNGSFESGDLQGFAFEGSAQVIKSWKRIVPTEQQYMVALDTMEHPIDGITTLTSEAFKVPEKVKHLLFDFHFAATALFKDAADVLEVQIVTGGTPTVYRDIFADLKMEIDAPRSGYDRGTGFRTAGVSVAPWAGTQKKISIKFVLKGRGKLPETIPGLNRFDHNPPGRATSSTALFLDNLRLSESEETSLPPITADMVSIAYDGHAVTTITTGQEAFPENSTFYIWTLGGERKTVELGDQPSIKIPLPVDEHSSIFFHFSYASPALSGRGRFFSPQIALQAKRPRQN